MNKDWQIYRWYCPNCGVMVFGHKCKDGSIKTVCPQCGTEMKMEEKGRRHNVLNLYAPKGAEQIRIGG